MITQRAIAHPAGELPACSCGKPPRHYQDARRASTGGGHFLECAPCDRRTQRHASAELAIADFHRLVGSRPVPARLTHVR